MLFAYWKGTPIYMGLTLLAIAGPRVRSPAWVFPKRPAQRATLHEPFHWNPFHDVWIGMKHSAVLQSDRAMFSDRRRHLLFLDDRCAVPIRHPAVPRGNICTPTIRPPRYLVSALAVCIGVGRVIAGRLSGDRREIGFVGVGSCWMGVFAFLHRHHDLGTVGAGLAHRFGIGRRSLHRAAPTRICRTAPNRAGTLGALHHHQQLHQYGGRNSGFRTAFADARHVALSTAAHMLLILGACTLIGTIAALLS